MKKSLLSNLVQTGIAPFIRSMLLPFLLVVAANLYADLPSVKVLVSDENRNVAFKGTTSVDTTFTTGNLRPGNYVVQFNSNNAAVEDNQYLLVVSAGKRKVTATDVAGEQFAGGGVAMRVKVASPLRMTGQIARTRLIDGKRFVWQTAETGSNLGGRWVEKTTADARQVVRLQSGFLRRMQDYNGEGSMLNRYHGQTYTTVHDGY